MPQKKTSGGTSTLTTATHTRLLNDDLAVLKGVAASEPTTISKLIARIVREWVAARAKREKAREKAG